MGFAFNKIDKNVIGIKNKALNLNLNLPALYTADDCVFMVAEQYNDGEFISLGSAYYFKNHDLYLKEYEKYANSHDENLPLNECCQEEQALVRILDDCDGFMETLNECDFGPGCRTGIYGLDSETGKDKVTIVNTDRTIAILKITNVKLKVTRDYFGEYDSETTYDFVAVSLDDIRADIASGKLPQSVLDDIENILDEELDDTEKSIFTAANNQAP